MFRTGRSQKSPVTVHLQPKQTILVLVLVLLLYVVIPQLGGFRHSLPLIAHVKPGWVIFGALCYLSTNILSTAVYRLLSMRPLPWGRTMVVQYGSSFASRLLPAGIGSLGVGYLYLRKQKSTPAAALAVVTLNNLLGTMGHIIFLIVIALFVPETFRRIHVSLHLFGQAGMLAGLVAVLCIIGVIIYLKFRRRLRAVVSDTAIKLGTYRYRKTKVGVAIACSMGLTLLYALCLWASAQALASGITMASAIVILGLGVSVGAIIPSPGGLGGAEAGLVAGLVAFGLGAPAAIAVAIVYRLASYWLGFVVGASAFFVAEKRGYF